jgi:L-alanine-DL-glutamate epimerase-like enolase superfamily enzyme
MKLRALRVGRFPVPFKFAFKHASARRAAAENVIVLVESTSGLQGVGEGCPRSYVTGETTESAVEFLRGHRDSLIDSIAGLDDLRQWIAAHEAEIDRNPAAFCAVELALLDLFGKEAGCSVERLLGLSYLQGDFQYSAILGDSNPLLFWIQFCRYWKSGFRDYKLKLSGDPRRDAKKLRHFRDRDDPALRVRFDANNLWSDAAACIDYLKGLDFPVFALEEPLTANDLPAFRTLAEALGTRIILDESLTRRAQLDALVAGEDHWVLNCRVSKLGGLLRSLDLVEDARARGHKVIVGAHVGETSILTRAALTLAHAAGDALIAQEGAFGTHLLSRDLCAPPLMFGDGGVLTVGDVLNPSAPGFGLAADTSGIENLSAK